MWSNGRTWIRQIAGDIFSIAAQVCASSNENALKGLPEHVSDDPPKNRAGAFYFQKGRQPFIGSALTHEGIGLEEVEDGRCCRPAWTS